MATFRLQQQLPTNIVSATNLLDGFGGIGPLTKDSSSMDADCRPASAFLVRHHEENGSNADQWLAIALSSQ